MRESRQIPHNKICNEGWPVRTFIRIDRTPIRKTFLASRSNRQRGGQASLTMHRPTRGRWMKGRNQTTQFRSAQNVTASCHCVRSERSPLHDVRQHAKRNSTRGRVGIAVRGFIFTDESCERVDGIAAGGARRDRTDDLLLAKQALSQLSYGPASHGTQQKREWWAWEDLNFRPHAYQARALTN